MSVPTITSVTPSVVTTVGDMMVTIQGTNFAVPVVDTTLNPDAPVAPNVVVLVDGVPATDIEVIDATEVRCVIPRHLPGAAALTVLNLNASLVPVTGEQVTLAGALTYTLPILTSDQEGDLARLIRTFIRVLKSALSVDVTYAVHTDYDPDTGDDLHITKFAKLPGISLVGPELRENRFYSLNEQPSYDDPNGPVDTDGTPVDFVTTRVPYTVDVLLTLVGASDSKIELLNLMQNLIAFMHKTKYLAMDRNATDPTQGAVSYELDFQPDGQPKTTTVPNNSNIRSFSSEIVIRGFDIEAQSGLAAGTTAGIPNQAVVEQGKTLDDLQLDPTVQTGVSSGPGPSPGP